MRSILSLVTLALMNTKSLIATAASADGLSRRRFITGACAATIGFGTPCLSAQTRLEKPKVLIALDGKASFHHLPLMVADQLGYFKAEGLEVEFVDMLGSAKAQQALASGIADVCAGAFHQVLQLHSKNQSVRAFVLQGRTPQCAFGLSTKSLPVKALIADLLGKKIGVPELGSTSHLLASTALMRAGIKPADVSYVVVGNGTSAINALREGQVDALSHTEPVITTLELRSEIKTINDARTLSGAKAVFGGTMPAACLYAPEEFLQKLPKTSQALANAVVHSLKWLQTAGPSDIIKTVPESYFSGDRSMYLAAFSKLRESICLDGLMLEDGPRTSLRALAGFDTTVETLKVDLQKTFTNQLAQRAKERFKS